MIELRRCRPEDIPTLVALFRDTIRRINSRDYSPEQIRAWAPDEIDPRKWAELLLNRFTVVAEIHGEIAGFGDVEDNGHLDHLFVHADHQGKGVARALVEAMEAEARKHGLARVFTEASITARPFFERQGYRVLQEQVVVCRGVDFINYRMEKHLEVDSR